MKERIGLNSFALKIIACISMFIDHLRYSIPGTPMFMSYIGRLAFPIFAFQISEGYIHTKNIKKYLIRLGIFGLVSQIPFSLYFKTSDLNVLFTLFTGLLCIFIFDKLKEKWKNTSLFISLPIIIFIAYLAEYFNFDYGFYGVTIIVLFYIFKENKIIASIAFIFATFIFTMDQYRFGGVVSTTTIGLFICTSLGIIPYLLYNGKQGYKSKYLIYLFYPCHLMLLYIFTAL